ncbi:MULTISPECIES: hypothetical protein [unclassified Microcoleus]|uniref:hypothetical protein n=1 Tax=unclassified Microcoleus TaxID=2642155 RepID=UPI002FD037EA
MNAARRQILPAGQFWDNTGILGWEKMLLCDRQQRSIAIGVTIIKVIGNWELVIGNW